MLYRIQTNQQHPWFYLTIINCGFEPVWGLIPAGPLPLRVQTPHRGGEFAPSTFFLINITAVWFYYNPGRFHPLYDRLLTETKLNNKITRFTHISDIS